MYFRSLVFLFSVLLSFNSFGQTKSTNQKIDSIFSKNVEVSLLTFGAANEPHSVWGHTAIRIKDGDTDLVYNYGQFDFDAPFFLLKFLRGKLNYSIGYNRYIDVYRYYEIFTLLKENYKEENRFYKYDFFFDNCSTRPLQIIEKSIGGKLMLKNVSKNKTFRLLLDQQLANHQWMDFGIDLIIGNRADKIPTIRQSTFLPPQLMKTFEKAKISSKPSIADAKTNKTVIKKLVKEQKTILEFDDTGFVLPKLLYPIWIFTLFLILEIIIFYLSYKKRKLLYKWYDKTWFIVAFISGLIIVFLWFFTDHLATKDNWNLLWLNPLFIFVFLKNSKIKNILMLIVLFLLFATLIGFSFIPQQLHPAIIPILTVLILKISKCSILNKVISKN